MDDIVGQLSGFLAGVVIGFLLIKCSIFIMSRCINKNRFK